MGEGGARPRCARAPRSTLDAAPALPPPPPHPVDATLRCGGGARAGGRGQAPCPVPSLGQASASPALPNGPHCQPVRPVPADNQLTGTIPDGYSRLSPTLTQISIGGNELAGSLYAFAAAQPQSVNVTFLPKACGMVPIGIAFGNGFDLTGSPGLGLPCPDELGGWPALPSPF